MFTRLFFVVAVAISVIPVGVASAHPPAQLSPGGTVCGGGPTDLSGDPGASPVTGGGGSCPETYVPAPQDDLGVPPDPSATGGKPQSIPLPRGNPYLPPSPPPGYFFPPGPEDVPPPPNFQPPPWAYLLPGPGF
jgi:hypothetical protein